MKCPYCESKMRYLKTEHLQLGKYSWLAGSLPNLLCGTVPAHIYVCPTCGKLEFFMPQQNLRAVIRERDRTPLKTCPDCFFEHDEDDRECPNCGHKYPYEDF